MSWYNTLRSYRIDVPRRITRTQQQNLLRMILLATRERLPLPPLVAALALDEKGYHRRRLQRFAELLESGKPLPDALDQVPEILPQQCVFAVRFGTQSGTLLQSLEASVESLKRQPHASAQRLGDTFVYVAVLLVITVFFTAFIMVKVIPTVVQILADSEIQAPDILVWFVSFCGLLGQYALPLFMIAVLFLLWAWSGRLGRSVRHGWLSRVLSRLVDFQTADVMRQLGVAGAAGRPTAAAISTMARYHQDPVVRRKLLFVRNEMELGADTWQSFEQSNLISAAEAAVLDAATRVGNLSWALQEVANCRQARVKHRANFVVELLRPAMILAVSVVVAVLAISVIASLTKMIQAF